MTDKWYTNKALLEAAREEYGTFERIAAAVGGADETTLARWWRRHGLERLPKGPSPSHPTNQDALRKLYERIG